MRIITTTNLLHKYNLTNDDANALLKTLSNDVDILDRTDYAGVKAHCDTVDDSLLLFGGHDVVPFAIIPNPSNDVDQQLYSDAPYACTQDALFYTPNKSVGRLPDEYQGASVDFIRTVVTYQKQHLDAQPTSAGWFNYVASVWKGISDDLSRTFNMNNQSVSPPTIEGNIPDNTLFQKRYHYLNLHGSQATPYYYGQGGGGYPTALAPTQGRFKDGLVFTEACYGGWLQDRNRNTSIPLMALFSGAVGVVSSTAVAYGPAQPPPDGADMLSMCFYQHLLAGESIGLAFLNAKKQFTTNILTRDGNIEPSNKKTLLSFNLYGTPDIKL